MKLTARMQTDKGDVTTVGIRELPYFILLASERHYMVIRAIKDTEESSLGIYRSAESWSISFFYISDLGVNYWIGLQRFTSDILQWRQNFRRGICLVQPRIPEPRPETAIWVETRERKGGLFFRRYLIYGRTVRTNTGWSNSRTRHHTTV